MTVSMFDKRPAGNAGLFLSDLRGISFYLLILKLLYILGRNISTLTLHFKDIEAPDRCSGDLGLCVLGNFVAI